jgi:hypothetical protein
MKKASLVTAAGIALCIVAVTTVPSRGQPVGPWLVPEARDFTLIYELDIPAESPGFHTNRVAYAVDASASFAGHFDRVAYYLELDRADGNTQWVYASMDAFTDDARKLRLPTADSGVFFQTDVTGLNVFSNVAGVITGTARSGNIELWPHNYAPTNGSHLSGGNNDVYDFADKPVDEPTGYGSFQVHHTDARQTVLAYNRWGLAGPSDVGIGNSPYSHPDWTFRQNAGDYTARTLYVLVRPAPAPVLRLSAPRSRAVYQRGTDGHGRVRVAGNCGIEVRSVEARLVPMPGDRAASTSWRRVAACDPSGTFSGTLTAGGGWYRLEARARGDGTVLASARVDRIGVGEVFVTAGQSNAANHGSPVLLPNDDRVSAWGPLGWAWAADPQPIATGTGGSPWPAMGDALVAALDVPVGLVSVAWGGTSIAQWQAGGTLYVRLRDALGAFGPEGARAVLWHQGESDAALGTTHADYADGLAALIAIAREDAQYPVPWGVARVGFLPGLAPEPIAEVVAGQNAVIATVPGVFAGPSTDDLVGPDWRYDTVHFNERGLREHGRRWAEAILAALPFPARAPDGGRVWLPSVHTHR